MKRNKKYDWKRSAICLQKAAQEMLFPMRCIVCDELMEQGQGQIHPACLRMLFPVSGAVCMHCGRPLAGSRDEFCYDCARQEAMPFRTVSDTFRQGKSLYLYKGEIKQTMYRFKYSNKREYASYFAEQAVRQYGQWLEKIDVDAVIPVPMYKKKEKRRGYNQATEFAKELVDAIWMYQNERNETNTTKKPVLDSHAVLRIRDTRPMKELNDAERKNNLRNAFQTTKNIVKYKKVLLVDDIYTTGSTVDAVSKELQAAGVSEVYVFSICIGKGV